jgi:hypothetical protein
MLLEWIKILGAIAGFAALIWRLIDEFGAYPRISVEVEGPLAGWTTVLTTVENRGNRRKNISNALLLIGPETESPLDSANVVAAAMGYKGTLQFTNDLELLPVAKPTYAGGRALIPLPFYYSENVDIGDETLTYRAALDAGRLTTGIPYAVRFFVFGRGRLHRSTHDSFINIPAHDDTQQLVGPERGGRVLQLD